MNDDLSFVLELLGAGAMAAVVIWGISVAWDRYRVVRVAATAFPIGLGALFAYQALSEQNGYIAGLVFQFPLMTSMVLALGSFFLLLFQHGQRSWLCGLVAAGLVLGTFYLVVGTAVLLGFRWQENPLLPISLVLRIP